MTATATVYTLHPSPWLDVAIRVIREINPDAVIVVADDRGDES